MIYGYARVSTAAQDESGQVRQLKAAGCEKIFREKITGTPRPSGRSSASDRIPVPARCISRAITARPVD
jgi:DNA invertase Pin-like site-specific DNA recombinase